MVRVLWLFKNELTYFDLFLAEPAWLWDSQPRMATPLGLEKFERIEFSLGRWPTRGKKRPNWWGNMPVEPWDLSEFFSIHFCGRGSHFPQGNFFVAEKGTNLEFCDSVLVFARWVIWHQEGYYCYIISQMNTYIINKILPRKCLALLTACRHLWQLHLVVLKFIQRNDTSRWR